MGIWTVLIISLVISTIAVNTIQRIFMKWLNIQVMFTRTKTKVITIVVITLLLSAIIINALGIDIPV